MRLLVTNDDGIDSVFLHALVAALRDEGHEPCVVAPQSEQSWIGAAKSRNRPVRSAPAKPVADCPAWVVNGTPSDCVNIALDHLLPGPPDAVLSGINVGLNASLGFIIASGTIAGAWEGALHGLPAAAFSQDVTFETYDRLKEHGGAPDSALLAVLKVSAARAASLVGGLFAPDRRRPFIVHNLNFPFPCRPDTPVRRTVPAHVLVPRLFSPQADDGTHRLIYRLGEDVSPGGLCTDKAVVAAGEISHSILDYTKLGVLTGE